MKTLPYHSDFYNTHFLITSNLRYKTFTHTPSLASNLSYKTYPSRWYVFLYRMPLLYFNYRALTNVLHLRLSKNHTIDLETEPRHMNDLCELTLMISDLNKEVLL